ncbi:MAG: hypothetical protein JRJ87_18265 [Deltaproteobacteria bacterium]|nr:hypothetical protein [Deltaproteobacteria bacterium]
MPATFDGQIDTSHYRFFFRERFRLVAEELAESADSIRAKVLQDLRSNRPDKTKIVVAGDFDDMQAAAPAGVQIPAWAAGVAFPRDNLILLRVKGDSPQASKIEQVFTHEWAHLALAYAVDFRKIPRWFNEGFAMYHSGEWSFSRTTTLASGVVSKRIFSLQSLTDFFPEKLSQVELAYAQSIDFVGFLLGEYGQEPFGQLIELLAQGWSFISALEEAYDSSLAEIEDQWRQDLKLRYTWIPLITGAATFWFLASLIFILAYLKKRRRKIEGFERLDDDQEGDNLNPPI